MKIAGLQPLSLIDYPEKNCAVIFTQGCPFRCPFCHNPELIPTASSAPEISENEIFEHLKKYQPMLDGVCITGGEPTLQPDLEDFVKKIKTLGFAVKLDTNGVHPEKIRRLTDQNLLDYLAMDLKHTWEKYDEVIRAANPAAIQNCRQTFEWIQNSGVDHEFRTTIFPGVHQARDFEIMAGYLKPGEKYFIQAAQFTKNLEPNLPRACGFVLSELIEKLQSVYPRLKINAR